MMRLFRRIQFLWQQRRMDRDLREEVEAHRLMRQQDLETHGVPPDEAAYASRRALGNITRAREDARGVWVWPWLESVCQDAMYALRVLRRAPAFGAAIVIVMALGIGATTAVFGLLDGLVLKSLPVYRPEQLVYVAQPSFSYPVFRQVRARGAHVFTTVSAWDMTEAIVEWSTELEPAEVLTASGGFYEMLGIRAAAGRTFGEDDDRVGGGAQGLVAVISDACWQRRFGRDMSAIGRTIRIDGRPFTIVGVTPPGFSGVTPGLAPEITIPLTSLADEGDLKSHSSSWVHMLGRLKEGVTAAQGDAALQSFWPSVLEATVPATMAPDRRAAYLSNPASLQSGRAGFSRIRNQFQQPLWLLLGFVSLLMTVACASAANLLLARAVARRREIAVRLSIGAGRGRLVRQMLTEVAVWTSLAAIAGVGFASWGGAALIAMMSTVQQQIVMDVTPSGRMFAFALGLAFVTAAVSALVPALRATQFDPASALKGDSGSTAGVLHRWSLSKTLVTTQVALTMVLLVGAALFVRSLQGLLAEDAGVDRHRVLVLATNAEAAGYENARLIAYYDRLLDRLRAIPGVESASLSQYPPISDQDGAWTQSVEVNGVELTPEPTRYVHFNVVSDQYFQTVGMRIVQGRDFGAHDGASAAGVVAINESLARRFFAGRNPLGQTLTIGRNKARRSLEIIAVVSDAKYQRLQEPNRSIAYLPRDQLAAMLGGRDLFAEVRAAGAMGSIAETMRREARALDQRVPMRVESVNDRIRQSVVRERVTTILAAGLGATALVLACAALYGLLAYAVSRQSYEIGLRLALGAERRAVRWLVLRECLLLAVIGIVAGLAASLALSRYVESLLHHVSSTDPIALAAAAALMLAVAALAGWIPARRASRVDPVVALRHV